MSLNNQEIILQVTHHLTSHAMSVKAAVAQKFLNINIISETIFTPVFNTIFNLPNLRNLNELKLNFPAIDLADDTKKIAIQITSSDSKDKIKKTLKLFCEKKLYEKYDRLIIYILTERTIKINKSDIKNIINGKFKFDVDKDIIDYKDLSKQVSLLDIDKARLVLDIFEANYKGGRYPVSNLKTVESQETLYLNWIPITVPKSIYVGDCLTDITSIFNSNEFISKKLKFAWVLHDKKILCFENIALQSNPLCKFVDQGTVEKFDSDEIFSVDDNYLNKFKQLLKLYFKNILSSLDIRWQYEVEMFIFVPRKEDKDLRKEKWKGKVSTTRTVYKHTYNSKDPSKSLNHKHFAFEIDFILLDNNWYLNIRPDWFISHDGYKKHLFGKQSIKYLKSHERNSHFFNHLRFINYFLKSTNPTFPQSEDGRIIIGDLIEFANLPKFNEPNWDLDVPSILDEVPNDDPDLKIIEEL